MLDPWMKCIATTAERVYDLEEISNILGTLAFKFNVPFERANWHNIIEELEA